MRNASKTERLGKKQLRNKKFFLTAAAAAEEEEEEMAAVVEADNVRFGRAGNRPGTACSVQFAAGERGV